MKYDIALALQILTPGAEWVLRGGEYSGLEWVDGHGYDKPTAEAITAKITELDNEEAMRLLREERDRRISLTDWRASSDLTISSEWSAYRQALRDLPATATPTLDNRYELDMTSVTWPTEPS
jgi:hypothetical protein